VHSSSLGSSMLCSSFAAAEPLRVIRIVSFGLRLRAARLRLGLDDLRLLHQVGLVVPRWRAGWRGRRDPRVVDVAREAWRRRPETKLSCRRLVSRTRW